MGPVFQPVSFFFETVSDAIHKAMRVVDHAKSVRNVQKDTGSDECFK